MHTVIFSKWRTAVLALPLAAALIGAGCSGSSTAATTTGPTTNPTTENFTGTVPVGGTDSHNVTVLLSGGQMNVIMTAAGPPATIYEGIGLGTPSGTTCTLLSGAYVVLPASTIAQLSGTVQAGTYCIAISDAGNQAAPITYAVTVTHY